MQVVRFFCLALLLALAVLQIRIALFEQTEYSRNESTSSLHKYQSNPYLLSWLAKRKHLFEADLETSASLYKQALQINSVYVPAWLGLAELQMDQHKKENANAILEYTSQLTEDVKRWRWDKALVAYQFNRKDILAEDLSYIIQEIPGKIRNDALRMAFSLWSDPMELQKQLGNGTIEYLFNYATRKKKVERALILWGTYKTEEFENKERDTLRLITMLMNQGELKSGSTIWRELVNPSSILFNGEFAGAPMQTAFGWRVGKNKGASWYFKEATKKGDPSSLHLHFKRQKNINLHNIYQIVPLQGGKVYALKGKVKTKNLTTDQLPFVDVTGYRCKAPYNKTEMVSSDQDWTDTILLFEVPDDCEAMRIRLRRKESTHIDNKLGGDIWLADFEIAETDEIFTILDEE